MSVPANPMVVVKKADGTTVRVPLSELRKKSQSVTPLDAKKSAAPAVVVNQPLLNAAETEELIPEDFEKSNQDARSKTPPVISPQSRPLPPPSKKIVREEPLLNESLQQHELKKPDMLGTLDYDAIAEQIIGEMGAKILVTVRGRAHSLCVSWLRGVRDDEQFTRYATLSPESGGVGMSAADTTIIIQKLRAAKGEPTVKELTKAPEIMPKNAATINSTTAQSATQNSPVDIMNMVSALGTKTHTTPRAGVGQVLHDVQRSNIMQTVAGPAEEMRSFSLVDWRRLGATPAAAREALFAKCTGWKDESYLLFLDAAAAWRESPLMVNYREKIVTALQTGRTLVDTMEVLSNNRLALTTEDLLEIAIFNRDIAT